LNGKAGMRWLAKTLPDIDEVRGGHDSIAASVSVLKLLESSESFVIQRRRSDSWGMAADVDAE
jgi:hypothetical protein